MIQMTLMIQKYLKHFRVEMKELVTKSDHVLIEHKKIHHNLVNKINLYKKHLEQSVNP